jgi:hypothetical protein
MYPPRSKAKSAQQRNLSDPPSPTGTRRHWYRKISGFEKALIACSLLIFFAAIVFTAANWDQADSRSLVAPVGKLFPSNTRRKF